MEYDLIIRNGLVVTTKGVFPWDIAVSAGKIAEVADSLPGDAKAAKVIDAKGLHVFPGLIDEHVHFDEPGNTHREGFLTGSSSVAASGVTTFFDHPISSIPPTIDPEAVRLKKAAAEQNCVIDYGIIGGLTADNREQLAGMQKLGIVAIKGFMSGNVIPYLNDDGLINGMDAVANIDGILLLHAENEAMCNYLKAKNTANGRNTCADFESSRPILSETESARRAVAFAEITGCRVHIAHASSREVVEVVDEAKARGIKVTVETCPHFLKLTVQDMPKLIATASPPLRPQKSVDSMWEAIRAGKVDTIGSDHSAWPAREDLFVGLSVGQSTLSVLLTEGYHKRGIPLERIVELTSYNIAKLFDLYPQKGDIAVGFDGDFAIVDLNEEFVLKQEDLHDRHKFSPYIGYSFKGAVKYTISRGEVVFQNGKILAEPGRGHMVTPLHLSK